MARVALPTCGPVPRSPHLMRYCASQKCPTQDVAGFACDRPPHSCGKAQPHPSKSGLAFCSASPAAWAAKGSKALHSITRSHCREKAGFLLNVSFACAISFGKMAASTLSAKALLSIRKSTASCLTPTAVLRSVTWESMCFLSHMPSYVMRKDSRHSRKRLHGFWAPSPERKPTRRHNKQTSCAEKS